MAWKEIQHRLNTSKNKESKGAGERRERKEREGREGRREDTKSKEGGGKQPSSELRGSGM